MDMLWSNIKVVKILLNIKITYDTRVLVAHLFFFYLFNIWHLQIINHSNGVKERCMLCENVCLCLFEIFVLEEPDDGMLTSDLFC